MEKLLTVDNLCELLQVKRGLVYKWVHFGYVPHVKIGNVLRFKELQIEKWIAKREKKGRITYKLKFDADENI